MIDRTPRIVVVFATAALLGGCSAGLAQVPVVPTEPPGTEATISSGRASVAPSAAGEDSALLLDRTDLGRPLVRGSYRIEEPFDVHFSLALPTEWTLRSLSAGDVTFQNTQLDGGEGAAWITIDRIDNVYDDPCHGGPITPPVSATVDGLVTALTGMIGFRSGPVSDVFLDGHAGKSVEIRNSIDTPTAGCKEGPMIPMWTVRGGPPAATNGGSRENLWVIDVDGAPLVIDGTMFIPATPEESRAEIEQVVQSLRFGASPPAPVPVAAVTATPTPSPNGPYLTYVALGDSLLYALEGDCDGCTSAAVTYGAKVQEDLGIPVDVHNLTMHNSLTSRGLLDYLTEGARIGRHGEDVFEAVAAADIVTVTIGFNDIGSWAPGATDLPGRMEAFASNLDGILGRIEALRAGEPTMVRVTQIYNNGGARWKKTVEAQNRVICDVAADHDAVCVDIYHPFNGADGTADPATAGYLGPDDTHPSQAGMDVIAAALAATGFAPLR